MERKYSVHNPTSDLDDNNKPKIVIITHYILHEKKKIGNIMYTIPFLIWITIINQTVISVKKLNYIL